MKNTEKVQKGELAIYFDKENDSLELLNKVLKCLFPQDPCNVFGNCSFYVKHGDFSLRGCDDTSLPTIPLTDIVLENNLCDWYIEATEENFKDLCEWRNQQENVTCEKSFVIGHILLSKHKNDNSFYYEYFLNVLNLNPYYKKYIQITYNQFKTYIMKQEEGVQYATREQLKEIYDEANKKVCRLIEHRIAVCDVFESKISFDERYLKEMFSFDNDNLLSKVFTKPKEDFKFPENARNIIQKFSKDLFGDGDVIDLLNSYTPKNRPDLNKKALIVKDDYSVETIEINGGTIINIKRK